MPKTKTVLFECVMLLLWDFPLIAFSNKKRELLYTMYIGATVQYIRVKCSRSESTERTEIPQQ